MAGVMALGAGEARANHVSCGDTITADTTLDSNLVNCPNNGIVIGADNITLDLNGHTIAGDGELVERCPPDESCDVGFDNAAGHNGVTIKNGKVRRFGTGVFVFGAGDNRLTGLSSARNLFSGIVVGESPRTQLRRSLVFANGLTTDQAGVVVFDSRANRVRRNRVFGNGDIGLFMPGFDHGRIRNNKLRNNPEAGMIVEGNRNGIRRNRLSRNGDGIVVTGNRNAIARNRIAKAFGCHGGCGFGISFDGGRDSQIARNVVAGTGEAGIRLGLVPRELEGSRGPVDTVVRRNRLRHANRDGVLVMSTARDTLLRRNRARRSKGDGIDVEARSTKLTRNRAVRNGDLGIEAVRGVTDGGGNVARHNGDPRQCTHVACS